MSNKKYIIGAIAGDIIGSVYEWNNIKTIDFDLFGPKSRCTDDSVLTIATMDKLVNQIDYVQSYQNFARQYPDAGYGSKFRAWMNTNNPTPYNSWGNGSAMRVSPIGWFFETLEQTLEEAKKSAECTHNHPEGIKGAQAVAACIWLARNGKSKPEIKNYVTDTFHYDLERKVDEIRPDYVFDVSCQGSVPEAIIAFLESKDFENAIRLAISLGGDSDTIACIAGGIAEAFYENIPDNIVENVLRILPQKLTEVVDRFSNLVNPML